MDRLAVVCVHGRFQPFHNGHLDYVRQAFDRSDFVHIGLTQIFRPTTALGDQDHRNTVESNPLTYFDRVRLITKALEQISIGRARYSFTPFPIETPDKLIEFVPLSVPCLTTHFNKWNERKIALLKETGYSVALLRVSKLDDIRIATGSEIRKLIRAKNDRWREFVPSEVARLIDSELMTNFCN